MNFIYSNIYYSAIRFLFVGGLLSFANIIIAQEHVLSLENCIDLVLSNSIQTKIDSGNYVKAQQSYNAAMAETKPIITANLVPVYFDRSFVKRYDFATNTEVYREQQNIYSNAYISVEKPIIATGASLILYSELNRFENLSESSSMSFKGVPLGLHINQPLNFYSKLKSQIHVSEVLLKYENGLFKKNIILLKQKTTTLYFDLARAQLQYKLAQNNLATYSSIYEHALALYQNAAFSKQQLLQLKLALLNAKSKVKIEAYNMLVRRRALNTLLNISDTIITYVNSDNLYQTDWAQIKANNSVELLFADYNLILAQTQLEKVRFARFADASVFADVGFNKSASMINDLYNNMKSKQLIQLGMKIPLFDFGRHKAQYKVAQTEYNVNLLKVNRLLANAEMEIANLKDNLQLKQQLIEEAKQAVEVAKQSAELTKKMFLEGSAGLMEFQNTLDAQASAELTLLQYIYDFRILLLDTEKYNN